MFYRAKSRIGLYDPTDIHSHHCLGDILSGQVVFAIKKVTVDFGYKRARNILCFNEVGQLGYCYFDSEHWEQV